MVDINLFKEDGEDDKEWSPEDSDQEDQLDDSLNDELNLDEEDDLSEELNEEELDKELEDDLGFDEDIEETTSLEDDELLADDDSDSDFDETDELEDEEDDYNYGDAGQKKASPVLWIILGAVVIGAVFYQFFLLPQQTKKKAAVNQIPQSPPDVQKLIADLQKQQAAAGDSSSIQAVSQQSDSGASGRQLIPVQRLVSSAGTQTAVSSFVGYMDKINDVLENLSRQSQLGTIILKDLDFHIGYVSDTPNAADAMGQRIEALLGVNNVKKSPEERHRTAGKIRYWGVVSGSLPPSSTVGGPFQSQNFSSVDDLFQWAGNLASNNQLSTAQTENFAPVTDSGIRFIPARVKIEGGKAETIQFLSSLGNYRGNFILKKLVIAPVNISDFNARQVRVVLDFMLRS